MNKKLLTGLTSVFLITIVLFLAGCSGSSPGQPQTRKSSRPAQTPVPTTGTPTPGAVSGSGQFETGQLSATIDQLTQQVLTNIREHGWNPNATTHGKTTGGLFINWKMGDPSQTNALKQGIDDSTSGSHDPQVDLYYLNALAEYTFLHPQDHGFDTDVQKALPLVIGDFANYNLPKGWIYFFLLRSGLLLHNNTLLNEAQQAASNYYTNWFDPTVGAVYNRKANPPDFNVEHTLNCGAALIDAGTRWNHPAWVQAGRETIDHTLAVALNPSYHLLYNQVQVGANGQLQIQNFQAKPSTQGNGAMALVTAYEVTHDQHYLEVAGQILQSTLTSQLWDQKNGGLFFALDLDTGKLEANYKETRSQTLSLVGLYNYNQVMQNLGQPELLPDKQQALINVLSNNFYQKQYHGFFYRMTPTFHVYVSRPGTGIGVEDFFTTEAMGTAMDALQQTEFAGLSS